MMHTFRAAGLRHIEAVSARLRIWVHHVIISDVLTSSIINVIKLNSLLAK